MLNEALRQVFINIFLQCSKLILRQVVDGSKRNLSDIFYVNGAVIRPMLRQYISFFLLENILIRLVLLQNCEHTASLIGYWCCINNKGRSSFGCSYKGFSSYKEWFLEIVFSGGLYLRLCGGGVARKIILRFDQSMFGLKCSSQDKPRITGVEDE